jgi:hypothetical protein
MMESSLGKSSDSYAFKAGGDVRRESARGPAGCVFVYHVGGIAFSLYRYRCNMVRTCNELFVPSRREIVRKDFRYIFR